MALGPPAATAWVDVLPSMRNFGSQLSAGLMGQAGGVGDAVGLTIGDKISDGIGKRAGKMSGALKGALGLGAAAAAAGAGLYQVGKIFDEVSDTIRIKTGQSGKALDGLVASSKEVGKTVPADLRDVGPAIAEVNVRLGATGPQLEGLTRQFLELSRITGTDLTGNIEGASRAFQKWSIDAAGQGAALDKVFRASQLTGSSVDRLLTSITKFAGPMQQFGFGFEQSLALLGQLDKAGVNTDRVMAGLNTGLAKLAKTGKEPASAFREVTAAIKNAGSESEANRLAVETFGARAGPELARAVRQGKLSVEDLTNQIATGRETILGAANDTKDFAERWDEFKNRVLIALEPIAGRVFDAVGKAFETFSVTLAPLLIDAAVVFFNALAWAFEVISKVPPPVLYAAAGLFTAIWAASKIRAGIDLATTIIGNLGSIKDGLSWIYTKLVGEAGITGAMDKIAAKGGLSKVLGIGAAAAGLAALVVVADTVLPQADQAAVRSGDIIAAQREDLHSWAEGLRQLFTDPFAFITAQIADFQAETTQLGNNMRQMGTDLQNWWLGLIAGIGAGWIAFWSGIGAQIAQRWTEWTGFWSGLYTTATTWWANLWAWATASWLTFWTNVGNWINQKIAEWTSFWTGLYSTATAWWLNLWTNLFRTATAWWLNLWTSVGRTWNEFWTLLQSGLTFAATWIANLFRGIVNGVGQIWNGIKRAVAAPINFVINTVWNNGLRNAWNTVARLVGIGEAGTIPLIPENARGGIIPGYAPGRDSVLSWLSPGEAVMRPEWARALGKDEIEAMNRIARTGGAGAVWNYLFGGDRGGAGQLVGPAHRRGPLLPGFQLGGMVLSPLNSPAVQRGLAFAKSMEGRPYVWGGAGPGGSDCSGFMSQITNALLGRNPHQRLFSTASFAGGRGAAGFIPGLISAFTIGVNQGRPGHMAGTLAGINVESGSGHGPMVGKIALGSTSGFRQHFSLPQVGGEFVGGGQGGFDFTGMIRDTINKAIEGINALVRSVIGSPPPRVREIPPAFVTRAGKAVTDFLIDKANSMFGALVGGGGAETWRGVVNQALAIMGLPLSLADITLRRLQQESGGSASIVNNWDSNARRGTPSVGLMQVIGPTYAANRHPRFDTGPYVHGVSINPLANILASMTYALKRYGSLPAAYGRPGGYDSGGWLPPGFSTVFNGTGKPEPVLTDRQWRAIQSSTVGSDQPMRITGQMEIVGDGLIRIVDGRLERVGTAIDTGRRV
jgi:phage-related minor tail protein